MIAYKLHTNSNSLTAGLPIPVVAVSAVVFYEHYGTDRALVIKSTSNIFIYTI